MHEFTKLRVWDRARVVALEVYCATDKFPDTERYGLVGQMRTASISVASNIAEGAARGAPKDFARFLRIASGSASELDTQIRISAGVGLIKEQTAMELVREIKESEICSSPSSEGSGALQSLNT